MTGYPVGTEPSDVVVMVYGYAIATVT